MVSAQQRYVCPCSGGDKGPTGSALVSPAVALLERTVSACVAWGNDRVYTAIRAYGNLYCWRVGGQVSDRCRW